MLVAHVCVPGVHGVCSTVTQSGGRKGEWGTLEGASQGPQVFGLKQERMRWGFQARLDGAPVQFKGVWRTLRRRKDKGLQASAESRVIALAPQTMRPELRE